MKVKGAENKNPVCLHTLKTPMGGRDGHGEPAVPERLTELPDNPVHALNAFVAAGLHEGDLAPASPAAIVGVLQVVTERVDGSMMIPQVQREAWAWAMENPREDGSLPSGKAITDHFEHKKCWARLIRQWGRRGRFDCVPARGEVTPGW